MLYLEPVDASQLAERYAGLVRGMARAIVRNSSVISEEDLVQEGMAALIVVAETYNASAGSLGAYVRTCVRNALVAEANKYCGIFTIDPRVRLYVNKIIKLRDEGYQDDQIMSKLGINSRKRFLTLTSLADIEYHDAELGVAVDDGRHFCDIESVLGALDEIGLTDREMTLVQLLIENRSKSAILRTLDIDNRKYRQLKSAITTKIKSWGRTG